MEYANEIWKDIPNYIGIYQCSNYGRVKNLKTNRFLKPTLSKNGYLVVNLHFGKLQKTKRVHQLVCISFLNHIPNGNVFVVNHIDGNKENNNILNLEIVSQRQNNTFCYRKDKSKFSSTFVGVSFCRIRNKWKSQIQINNKKITLGVFATEIEAHNAYLSKLDELLISDTRAKPRM